MLLSLHIENIAVINKIDIDFSRGFTALTGETGAGKSVIVESIKLLFGAKAERELIRSSADFAMVSGLFGGISASAVATLGEVGVYPDEDGNILIQRTVMRDGRSQTKINGRSVTISLLKSCAVALMSIHGQSDTAALTAVSNHIELLDTYGGNAELLSSYAEVYSKLEQIRAKISDITEKAAESERLREMLIYQIKDIDSVGLHPGEEEELVEKKVKIRNSEKISKHADFVYRALLGAEKVNVANLLDKSANSLSQLSEFMPACADFSDKLREFMYQIEDIAESVSSLCAGIGDDADALNSIEERLDKIAKLKRKYGLTVDAILEYAEKSRAELETLENSEEILKILEKEENELYAQALKLANELHDVRVQYAKLVSWRQYEREALRPHWH